MMDLPGPKIRLGELRDAVKLNPGEEVHFTTETVVGNSTELPINYVNLPREIEVGGRIFINDGFVEIRVTSIDDDYEGFSGIVISGGEILSYKGLNCPGTRLTLRPPTENDVKGIGLGIELNVDWFAMSFVRSRRDVEKTRKAIQENGGDQPIVSKIEHGEAVKNIDEIIQASDSVMVARGDLGVELPPWEIPLLQKQIILKARDGGKPVIVATQMLDSMRNKPQPTRAETSDVANAIIDGADAVMLSDETAIGAFPVESVKVMSRIAQTIESESQPQRMIEKRENVSIPDTIGRLVTEASENLLSAAIIVITRSGFSARMISKHRPKARILAVTKDPKIAGRIRLHWGVEILETEWTQDRNELIRRAVLDSIEKGVLTEKDDIIIASGSDLEAMGRTSRIEILRTEDILKI
jgi:pyruvate kinase